MGFPVHRHAALGAVEVPGKVGLVLLVRSRILFLEGHDEAVDGEGVAGSVNVESGGEHVHVGQAKKRLVQVPATRT